MNNGGCVRITAPCGVDQTVHEQAIEWILDRHAHAHNKGRGGLPAAGCAIQAERLAQPQERPAGRRTGAEPEARRMSEDRRFTPGEHGHRPARHPISRQHRGDFTAAGSGQHHSDEHTVSSLLLGLLGLSESGQPEADIETGWEACA